MKAMKKYIVHLAMLAVSLTLLGFVSTASAAGEGDEQCPVREVNGQSLDEEFGEGSSDITHCLGNRHKVKLVVQVNQYCARPGPDGTCARAYALHNIENVIKDYEVTNGMVQGRDYEIAAIVHSGGGSLVVKDGTSGDDGTTVVTNEFEDQVQDLMNKGVKFYFCQNTVRGFIKAGRLPAGDATSHLVASVDDEGNTHTVEYVSAGISALADFQSRGWTYVQP
jgi:intracellular sulfur oxidation DsrE/DsrF family protein